MALSAYASSGTSPGRRGAFGATKMYHRLSLQTTLTTVIPVFSRPGTLFDIRPFSTAKNRNGALD